MNEKCIKKVALIRSNPYDFDPNSYNVQEIGMGKAFCDLGYAFDFYTFKKKNQNKWIFAENNGCKAQWIEVPRIRFLRMGFNSNICKKEFLAQYDLVICREYYQFVSYKVACNHNNVVIYNGPYWNMFMIKPFSYLYDFLFTCGLNKRVKCIFTKSKMSTDFLRRKGYDKLHTLGVALDTSRFDNVELNYDTLKIVDFMKKHECILYVGTLDKNKNYAFMLEVYEKLLLKYPHLKFVVIGKSKQNALNKLLGKKDESYEQRCLKHVHPRVKEGILRVQYIENAQLKYIYPLAKTFLLPSKKEIFGMVLLEAMYFGAPVISSSNGGSETLIRGNETGIIENYYDSEKWAKSISKYLDDGEYAKRIKSNAHVLIREKYNWKNIVGEIMDAVK